MVTTIKLAICQVTKMMSNRHHIHLPAIPPECCSGRPSTFWFLEPEALQAIQPMQVEDMSAVFFCHFNDISVHELGDPQIMQRNKKKWGKKEYAFITSMLLVLTSPVPVTIWKFCLSGNIYRSGEYGYPHCINWMKWPMSQTKDCPNPYRLV